MLSWTTRVAGGGAHGGRETEAKAIVALTESGGTARMIARFHPRQIVFVMTSREHVARKMALSFGCIPMPTKDFAHIGHATEVIDAFMKKRYRKKQGEGCRCGGTSVRQNRRNGNMVLVTQSKVYKVCKV